MRNFRILSEASEELDASIHRYESQQPGLGSAFLSEFRQTRERIGELPKVGRIVRADIRRRQIYRFPYAVLYRATDKEIVIVAIAHRRRRPGFWHGRQ